MLWCVQYVLLNRYPLLHAVAFLFPILFVIVRIGWQNNTIEHNTNTIELLSHVKCKGRGEEIF